VCIKVLFVFWAVRRWITSGLWVAFAICRTRVNFLVLSNLCERLPRRSTDLKYVCTEGESYQARNYSTSSILTLFPLSGSVFIGGVPNPSSSFFAPPTDSLVPEESS